MTRIRLKSLIKNEVTKNLKELNPSTYASAADKASKAGKTGQAERIMNSIFEKNLKNKKFAIRSIKPGENIFIVTARKCEIDTTGPIYIYFHKVGLEVRLMGQLIMGYIVENDMYTLDGRSVPTGYNLSKRGQMILIAFAKAINKDTKISFATFGPSLETILKNQNEIDKMHTEETEDTSGLQTSNTQNAD